MIRKQLEDVLGVKVDAHKDFIRSQVRASAAATEWPRVSLLPSA
jgi:hypothetical protein